MMYYRPGPGGSGHVTNLQKYKKTLEKASEETENNDFSFATGCGVADVLMAIGRLFHEKHREKSFDILLACEVVKCCL